MSNIIIIQLQSQFQRCLYRTLCVFSQIKDTKHHTEVSFCRLLHVPGVGLGGTGVFWACNDAPSTARSSWS